MPHTFRISRQFVEVLIQPLTGMLRIQARPAHMVPNPRGELLSLIMNYDAIVSLRRAAARCLEGKDDGDRGVTEIEPIRGRGGLLKLYRKNRQAYMRVAFHQQDHGNVAGDQCPQCGQGRISANKDSLECVSCGYTPGRYRIALLPSELDRIQASCEYAMWRQAFADEITGTARPGVRRQAQERLQRHPGRPGDRRQHQKGGQKPPEDRPERGTPRERGQAPEATGAGPPAAQEERKGPGSQGRPRTTPPANQVRRILPDDEVINL